MPSSSSLTPKLSTLLRVSESQAISNSSSSISSSSSFLFDRISYASSDCLTDISPPFTPSAAEFDNGEEDISVTLSSDSPTEEACGRRDNRLFSQQSRLPRPTSGSLINRFSRLDRACTLRPRSSVQRETPFVSLIHRLERANPTVATKRALEIMYSGGRPPTPSMNEGVQHDIEAPVTVVITAPDSPVEDWSSDFELGSLSNLEVCPEASSAVDTTANQLTSSESDQVLEIAEIHSSILFPSTSYLNLLDEVEQDTPVLVEPFLESPSRPILESAPSPSLSFSLETPDLSANWDSRPSLSTLMAESPPLSPISLPENMSINEEEVARVMQAVISFPTRAREPFSGSPTGDIDVATMMRLEIASTFIAGHQPQANQTRTLIGLGVAMPVIYPPLPETLFPYHHPPGATLNSRSLRELGYQSFDDKMFEIEQSSLAMFSRNVNESEPSHPGDVETDVSELNFEINLDSPFQPLLPEIDFKCNDVFQIEQAPLSLARTPLNHTSPIAFGTALVGLGLSGLTEASVESHSQPQPSPTTGRHNLVSADESVTETEVALPPVTDFYLQAQNFLNFEPLGVQKTIELDASQLERQSALYNLEHSDLQLDHIFSHSPPIRLEKRTEIERQLLSSLFKNKSPNPYESHPCIHTSCFSSPSLSLQRDYSHPYTLSSNDIVGIEPPPVLKQSVVSNQRNIVSERSRSYRALKKLGLERLAIFRPRSGRDDLVLTSPTVTTQDDPRSPRLSTLERVFLTFTSINPPDKMQAAISTGLNIDQFSDNVPHPKPEVPSRSNKSVHIGLGLPSHVALRRLRLQQTSSEGNISAVRCQSRRFSQECQNPSFIVTEPSFGSYGSGGGSRVPSVNVSNKFLKPSHFVQRSLYDIAEVPTPPSSTSSFSPCGTPSPRNQWSSPFIRINPPQKKRSSRSQLSTPTIDSPDSIHTEPEVVVEAVVEATDVTVIMPLPEVPEVPVIPAPSTRPGFKHFVSKLTRNLFKRSRLLKTNELVSSPVLVEHADAPPGIGLLQQDNRRGASGSTKEEGFMSSISVHGLQLLF